MNSIPTSYAEIVRVGGWALRGAGYPFGTAERAVRLLAYTEAVGGEAIESLKAAEADIARWGDLAPIGRAGDAASGRRIVGHGRHLLEVGGPAADLATADARTAAAGYVACRDVIGFEVIPALANLLARRGLCALLFHRAANRDRLPATMSRAGWICAAPGAEGPRFLQGEDVRHAVQACATHAASELTATVRQALVTDADGAERSFLGIVALPGGQPAAEVMVEGLRGAPAARPLDLTERFATALSEGFPIDPANLQYLYDLEIRTWAPTSERSRGQAGFGVF